MPILRCSRRASARRSRAIRRRAMELTTSTGCARHSIPTTWTASTTTPTAPATRGSRIRWCKRRPMPFRSSGSTPTTTAPSTAGPLGPSSMPAFVAAPMNSTARRGNFCATPISMPSASSSRSEVKNHPSCKTSSAGPSEARFSKTSYSSSPTTKDSAASRTL